jgi:hypothetical protein
MSSIDFVLNAFDREVQMAVAGAFPEGEAPVDISANAVAVVYAKTADFNNLFMFSTDATDIDNAASTDIKYLVNSTALPADLIINPCHAYVTTGAVATVGLNSTAYADDRLLVKHDFIRNIADQLFNTYLGVDLFANEDEMKYDLASKGDAVWNDATTGIKKQITDYDMVTSTSADVETLTIGTTNYKCLPDTLTDATKNFPRVLFQQMLHSASGKTRLIDLDANKIEDKPGVYKIPFLENDSISFKLTLKAEPTQKDLTGVDAVEDRIYHIKIILKDTVTSGSTAAAGVNVEPTDTESSSLANGIFTVAFNGSYPYSA